MKKNLKNKSTSSHQGSGYLRNSGFLKPVIKFIPRSVLLICIIIASLLMSCSNIDDIDPIDPENKGSANDNTGKWFENLTVIQRFETTDLKDLQNGKSPHDWKYFFISNNGEQDHFLNSTVLMSDKSTKVFSKREFMVNKFEEKDLLKISWKVKLKSLDLSGPYYPRMAAGIRVANHPVEYLNWSVLKEQDNNWIVFTDYFPVQKKGNYQLFLSCDLRSPVNQMTILWKEFTCELVREKAITP